MPEIIRILRISAQYRVVCYRRDKLRGMKQKKRTVCISPTLPEARAKAIEKGLGLFLDEKLIRKSRQSGIPLVGYAIESMPVGIPIGRRDPNPTEVFRLIPVKRTCRSQK
jgi:hypothetical protein